MARSLKLTMDGEAFSVPIEKVDRKKLYGWVEKHYYDRDGDECHFGSLSSDGITIFGKESFESGYVNEEGQWCDRVGLTAVDAEGAQIPKHESSFQDSIQLDKRVSIDDYLQHVAKSVYQLSSPELLTKVRELDGEVFTFPFNYYASYQPDSAFLIDSDDTLFMVVAQPTNFEFIDAHQVEPALISDEEDEDEADDDIDFSMF